MDNPFASSTRLYHHQPVTIFQSRRNASLEGYRVHCLIRCRQHAGITTTAPASHDFLTISPYWRHTTTTMNDLASISRNSLPIYTTVGQHPPVFATRRHNTACTPTAQYTHPSQAIAHERKLLRATDEQNVLLDSSPPSLRVTDPRSAPTAYRKHPRIRETAHPSPPSNCNPVRGERGTRFSALPRSTIACTG